MPAGQRRPSTRAPPRGLSIPEDAGGREITDPDSDEPGGDVTAADGGDGSGGTEASDNTGASDATDSGTETPAPGAAVEAYDGCGCRLASERTLPVGPLVLMLLALAAWIRQRRHPR